MRIDERRQLVRFQVRAQARDLELMSWVDAELPSVFCGDSHRVRQVLTNLMTNAVKFTADGEVTVRVTGAPAGERVVLRFEVTDTGIGIAPASLSRIFDSFAQQDGSTTRRFGGTGLGLAISRQLTELMGEAGYAELARHCEAHLRSRSALALHPADPR